VEGDGRPREDTRRGSTGLTRLSEPTEAPETSETSEAPPAAEPADPEESAASIDSAEIRPLRGWFQALRRGRGPWRVAVVEASMLPAIEPGDWLLIDPTVRRWPRRGTVVVFEEPDSAELSIKRVAAGPGDAVPVGGGYLRLRDDEAWLAADADAALTSAAGFGAPRDSRQFGPVPLELLVGRAWFRYAPWRRIGPIRALRPGARIAG
jgi:hypothetical protein